MYGESARVYITVIGIAVFHFASHGIGIEGKKKTVLVVGFSLSFQHRRIWFH